MKRLLLIFLLVFASTARAQVAITEVTLTPDSAASIAALYNDARTTRLSGDSRVAPGSEMDGTVAVLEGGLVLSGHIRGSLLVINGDVTFEPGARVDGTVIVVGGTPRTVKNLGAEQLIWYRERLKYELRDGQLVTLRETASREISAGRQFSFGRGDILVAARGGYNRSEGLPVDIGPRFTSNGRNPLLLEGLYIFRSASALKFRDHEFGYALRAEQFVGGKGFARLGVRYASEVLPIEQWGLSDHENSLATFLLHEDYRDHYERDGWSAYLAAGRGGYPLDWRVQYDNARFSSAALHDPFTLRDNPNPWRPEIHIEPERFSSVSAQLKYDTRNEDRDPASGWLARFEIETGLNQSYSYSLIDVRRYARLSPLSRVSLRAVVAGSVNGGSMPVFRQQALGGPGSLPGYELYRFDCHAHELVSIPENTGYYGCDRLTLLQLEYQARFRWLSIIGRSIGRDFGLLENIRGVLFFDSGRTWTDQKARGPRSGGSGEFAADAGFGLRFGTIGVYWALPLSARADGLHFFVRLEPRF